MKRIKQIRKGDFADDIWTEDGAHFFVCSAGKDSQQIKSFADKALSLRVKNLTEAIEVIKLMD